MTIDLADRSRSSLASQVYSEILNRIQRGQLSPQDRLVDTAVAAELSVSRMPVREAMLRLANEGYLVSTTRGFMLPKLSLEDIAEIHEMRRLLEPRAAAGAVRVLTDLAIRRLEEANEAARAAAVCNDPTGFISASNAFRQVWLQATPNRRLAATISRFADQVQTMHHSTLYDADSQRIAAVLIADVLRGFQERDALGVHDRVAALIDRGRERFLLSFPQGKLPDDSLRVS